MPMMNQTINRRQVGHGSAAMSVIAESAPAGATNQTNGVLNCRGKLGSRTRSTRIPTETMTNASNVPMEQRLPASRTLKIAEKIATPTPVTIEVNHGVRKRGCTRLTNGGSRPSRGMPENNGDWPDNNQSRKDGRP